MAKPKTTTSTQREFIAFDAQNAHLIAPPKASKSRAPAINATNESGLEITDSASPDPSNSTSTAKTIKPAKQPSRLSSGTKIKIPMDDVESPTRTTATAKSPSRRKKGSDAAVKDSLLHTHPLNTWVNVDGTHELTQVQEQWKRLQLWAQTSQLLDTVSLWNILHGTHLPDSVNVNKAPPEQYELERLALWRSFYDLLGVLDRWDELSSHLLVARMRTALETPLVREAILHEPQFANLLDQNPNKHHLNRPFLDKFVHMWSPKGKNAFDMNDLTWALQGGAGSRLLDTQNQNYTFGQSSGALGTIHILAHGEKLLKVHYLDSDQTTAQWLAEQENIYHWEKLEVDHEWAGRIANQISALKNGNSTPNLHLGLDDAQTGFKIRCILSLRNIPVGSVSSYGKIAANMQTPGGARAVGKSVGSNDFALLFPCHRVISKEGLTGYRWGLVRKSWLLLGEYLLSR